MTRSWTLARLELKSLFTGIAVPAGFFGILLAGVYGLYSGETVVSRQRAVLEESPTLYEDHQSYVLSLAADAAPAGDLLYYSFLHTHHEPSRCEILRSPRFHQETLSPGSRSTTTPSK